jgi:hypothetical protein
VRVREIYSVHYKNVRRRLALFKFEEVLYILYKVF